MFVEPGGVAAVARPVQARRVPAMAPSLAEAAVAVDRLDVLVAGRDPDRLAQGHAGLERTGLLQLAVGGIDREIVVVDDRVRGQLARLGGHRPSPLQTHIVSVECHIIDRRITCRICRSTRNLIGGELMPAASGAVMDTINPAIGEVWAQIPPYLSCGP
jgi:hypothetical protein